VFTLVEKGLPFAPISPQRVWSATKGSISPGSFENVGQGQRSSSRSTCPGPRGGPLIPVRKQPGLKVGAFSPTLLVPVAITGTNVRYKPGPMAFFPPVSIFPDLNNLALII
jgi:hypothetical protein